MAAEISPYGGSQPTIVRECLALLPDHPRYAFVDLGCGKGRPLVVASEFPFCRVIGIEIAPGLGAVARANAAVIASRYPDRTPIEVEVGDATAVAPPCENVVYFMYHPFGRSLVSALVANLESQLQGGLRQAFVVYYNPVHGEVFDKSVRFSRWHADTVSYAPSELGYGPDLEDTFVIWQTVPEKYRANPRATREIIVHESGSSARLETRTSDE
jgi:SAM-dependent methyltransferase